MKWVYILLHLGCQFVFAFHVSCQEKLGMHDQWKNCEICKYEIFLLDKINRIQIRNKSNKLYLEEYKPSEKIKESNALISGALPKFTLFETAKEVWSHERTKELSGENLIVLFYMLDNGKLEEMVFSLKETTKVNPEEITLLEQKLQKLRLPLQTDDIKGSNYITFSLILSFNKLLEEY